MCTGRVDLAFVLRAFSRGADGVFIGGCWPGECHYVTEGNYDALFNMHLCRRLLREIGIDPLRLRLEWIAASEGARYAEVMNDFGRQLRQLGPLGQGEDLAPEVMKLRLEALNRMVPYIKLVERERLRARFATMEEYEAYFASEDFERLFRELLLDRLHVTLLTLLLRERQLTSGEIAEALDLPPAEVARHLKNSTMYGLVRFDEEQKRFALA